MLKVDVRRKKSAVIVSLAGELDCAGELACKEVLDGACADLGRKFVIDLSGLTFMGSTGIRLLLQADERSRLSGLRRPEIRGTSQQIMRVLALAGVSSFLNIEPGSSAVGDRPAGLGSAEHPSSWGRPVAAS